MAPERRHQLLVLASLALLISGVLWRLVLAPGAIAYPPNSIYTDLLISHLPNAAYIRQALADYGQFPLWNAQILAGQPLIADPLAGVWYPPNLALLILPLPFAFNLLLWLHLVWASLGLYRWLREAGLPVPAALLGGLAFAGTPKLIAHWSAGHVSLVFAVAWTPWLLRAVRDMARQGGLRAGATAGTIFAMLFLADLRWSFYAAWLAAGYWLSLVWVATREGHGRPGPEKRPSRNEHVRAGLGLAVMAGLLMAGLAVPLLEFLGRAPRAVLALADAAIYSLPARYLLGLVIPDLGGFHEWMTYLGIVPLLLAGLGVGRKTWGWAALAVFCLAFALGENFGLFPALFRLLPGMSLLRVPPRILFLNALAVSILAAYGGQRLTQDGLPWLAARYGRRPPAAGPVLAVLLGLTLLDLARVGGSLIDPRPVPATTPAAAWLEAQPGLFRVYSPSYSLPMGDRLQHLDGVDPLMLAASVEAIETAIGVKSEAYAVAIPVYADDGLPAEQAGARPDAERLGQLNVKYVATDFALQTPGFRWLATYGPTTIYENEARVAYAWLEGEPGEPVVQRWSPNKIEVQATGPGRLVVSEVMYPGWQAEVDGARVEIQAAQGVFRSVEVPAGEHRVTFEFRPRSVMVGGLLSLLGWGLAGALALTRSGTGVWLGRRERAIGRRAERVVHSPHL